MPTVGSLASLSQLCAITKQLPRNMKIGRMLCRMQVKKEIHNIKIILNQGRYSEAKERAKNIIKTFPNDFNCWELLGIIYSKTNQFRTAEKIFKKALELAPKAFSVWYNLAQTLKSLGDIKSAIDGYKKCIELKPDFLNAFIGLGNLYFEQGIFSKAEAIFRKIIDLNKNHAPAHYSLGLVLHQVGRLEEAEKSYKKSILLNPKLYQAYSNRAVILSTEGRFSEAISSYEEALLNSGNNALLLNNLGNAYEAVGNKEKAIICFQKAIETDPKYADAHYNLGLLLEKLNRYIEAKKHFRLALEAKSDFEDAKHMLSALEGITTNSAPLAYVKNLFDGYAKNFENSLVKKLEYTIPEKLSKLILAKTQTRSYGAVLDLGCGTGLLGNYVKDKCEYLEGIDISPMMLRKAKEKKIYDSLKCVSITNYLAKANLYFHNIIATDVFIYIGELSQIFNYIKKRSKISGHFSFSTEHSNKDKYYLEKTGRYSHSRDYIERLCLEHNFDLKYFQVQNLRKEKSGYIKGGLYILSF